MKAIPFLILILLTGPTHAETASAESLEFPLELGSARTVAAATSAEFSVELGSARSVAAVTSSEFPVDVRDKGGVGNCGSAEFALNTQTFTPGFLELVGPHTVMASSQTPFPFFWHAGTSTLDVSKQCGYRFLTPAPAGSGFAPGLFVAGDVSVPTTLSVVISYVFISGQSRESAPFEITIMPRMQARAVAGQPQPGSGIVNFSVAPEGVLEPTIVQWDTDGDGFDDGTGVTLTHSYGTQTGLVRVKVKITDSTGASWIEEVTATLSKPPVANQPVALKPAVDPVAMSLFLPNGTYDAEGEMLTSPAPFVFNAGDKNRRDSGLVVIVHGLWSDAKSEWLTKMGKSIESRCDAEQITPPDIALMDWSFDSKNPAPDGPKLLGSSNWPADKAADIAAVKGKAYKDAQYLASWIYDSSRAVNLQQIDAHRPIHLIGHSAGGFVVGQAARLLKNHSGAVYVDRVTMLDTPRPYVSHLALGEGDFPNPGTIDRYSSTHIGNTNESGAPEPHAWYRWFEVFKSEWAAKIFGGEDGHSYAHEWYTGQTTDPVPVGAAEIQGFWFSPIINPATRIPKPYTPPQVMASMQMASNSGGLQTTSASLPDIVPTGWETFGSANESSGTWTFTESADTGIWNELMLPATAATLAFEFHFLTPGDGDFLALHFGDNPVLYQGLDLPLSRDAWLPAEIPLDLPQSALSGKLVFTLVSRGGVNAQVRVRNIRIIQNEDADYDGLTVDAETLAGSDARNPDSDSDGISDGNEVNVHGTDPNRADSDGDGQPDNSELAAGTNPLANGSLLRVTLVAKSPGGFVLNWSGVSGKTYRVMRSQELGTGNFETLAFSVPGMVPITTYVDPNPPTQKAFYWIEVE